MKQFYTPKTPFRAKSSIVQSFLHSLPSQQTYSSPILTPSPKPYSCPILSPPNTLLLRHPLAPQQPAKQGLSIGEQGVRTAAFGHLSLLHHQHTIAASHALRPMGNGEHGATFKLPAYNRLKSAVRCRIYAGRCFVNQQDLGARWCLMSW